MASRIAIIDGHPDPDRARFVHALAAAYDEGAREQVQETRLLILADLEFPMIRTRAQWESAEDPAAVALWQDAIRWADHIVIPYPLWHGHVAAYLKAYLEQLMRPSIAREYGTGKMLASLFEMTPVKLLRGRSAPIIVNMGMPTILYRVYRGPQTADWHAARNRPSPVGQSELSRAGACLCHIVRHHADRRAGEGYAERCEAVRASGGNGFFAAAHAGAADLGGRRPLRHRRYCGQNRRSCAAGRTNYPA
jgi:putative NADPH-quinone reductase